MTISKMAITKNGWTLYEEGEHGEPVQEGDRFRHKYTVIGGLPPDGDFFPNGSIKVRCDGKSNARIIQPKALNLEWRKDDA